jgi:hypothetical protein
MIELVAVQPTANPERAMIEFRNYFDQISRTNNILDPTASTSPLGNITDHDKQQDALIGGAVERSGGKIKLGELPQFWDNKVMSSFRDDKPGDFFYKREQHVVDHVLCHLTGYKLYHKHKGNNLSLREFIEGRDIILFAVMYAVPTIQKGMKQIIMEEFI